MSNAINTSISNEAWLMVDVWKRTDYADDGLNDHLPPLRVHKTVALQRLAVGGPTTYRVGYCATSLQYDLNQNVLSEASEVDYRLYETFLKAEQAFRAIVGRVESEVR